MSEATAEKEAMDITVADLPMEFRVSYHTFHSNQNVTGRTCWNITKRENFKQRPEQINEPRREVPAVVRSHTKPIDNLLLE